MSSLTNNLYQFGEFRLDAHSRVLQRDGTIVPLTPKAFDVLLVLIRNAGKVVAKKGRVIELLQKAYAEHSNAVLPIKVDPIYDPVRSDPRFQDLLRRLGLESP